MCTLWTGHRADSDCPLDLKGTTTMSLKPCPHCCRKVRLSPKRAWKRRQCGQALTRPTPQNSINDPSFLARYSNIPTLVHFCVCVCLCFSVIITAFILCFSCIRVRFLHGSLNVMMIISRSYCCMSWYGQRIDADSHHKTDTICWTCMWKESLENLVLTGKNGRTKSTRSSMTNISWMVGKSNCIQPLHVISRLKQRRDTDVMTAAFAHW